MEKYRTSDILFGTRERLLELRQKLLLLEELTSPANKKSVKKIIYRIVPNYIGNDNDDSKFICDLYDKRRALYNIMDFLRFGHLQFPTTLIDSLYLEKDNNGDYILKNSDVNHQVYITDQTRFKEIINEIQDLDYSNKLPYKKIRVDENNHYKFISFSYDGMYASDNTMKGKKYGQLFYQPAYDLISADVLFGSFPPKSITEAEVRDLLNLEVNGEFLSDYQRFLIDNSESTKKEIIIDPCSEKIAYYGIEEDKDSIHLVKRTRKSLYP